MNITSLLSLFFLPTNQDIFFQNCLFTIVQQRYNMEMLSIIIFGDQFSEYQWTSPWLKNLNSDLITLTLNQPIKDHDLDKDPGNYIIFLSEGIELDLIIKALMSNNWNRLANYILVAPDTYNIQYLFDYFKNHVTNLVFMLHNPSKTFASIYSWRAQFGPEWRCTSAPGKLYVAGFCDLHNNFSYLFLGKRIQDQNLNRCTINISTRVFPPFVLEPKTVDPSKNFLQFDSGAEIDLLRAIGKKMNFTCSYAFLPLNQSTRTTFESLIFNSEIDLIIGSLPVVKKVVTVTSIATPYLMGSIAWYVPAGEEAPEWHVLVYAMDSLVWAFMLLSLFTFPLIIYFFDIYSVKPSKNSFQNVTQIFLLCIGTLLGVSTGVVTKVNKTKIRLCLAVWMFACQIISTFYQSSMTDMLTTRRSLPSIDTEEKIFKNKFRVCLTPGVYNVLEDEGIIVEGFAGKSASFYTKDTIDDCLRDLIETRKVAVLNNPLYVEYAKLTSFMSRSEEILLLLDRQATFFITLYLKSESIFRTRVDKVIERLISGGFIDFWWSKILFRSQMHKKWKPAASNIFTLRHLQSAFCTLAIGYCISFLVFFCELMTKRKQTKNNPSFFIN